MNTGHGISQGVERPVKNIFLHKINHLKVVGLL